MRLKAKMKIKEFLKVNEYTLMEKLLCHFYFASLFNGSKLLKKSVYL